MQGDLDSLQYINSLSYFCMALYQKTKPCKNRSQIYKLPAFAEEDYTLIIINSPFVHLLGLILIRHRFKFIRFFLYSFFIHLLCLRNRFQCPWIVFSNFLLRYLLIVDIFQQRWIFLYDLVTHFQCLVHVRNKFQKAWIFTHCFAMHFLRLILRASLRTSHKHILILITSFIYFFYHILIKKRFQCIWPKFNCSLTHTHQEHLPMLTTPLQQLIYLLRTKLNTLQNILTSWISVSFLLFTFLLDFNKFYFFKTFN